MTLFAGSSCAHGPEVNGCVVDPLAKGFDCAVDETHESFVKFEDSPDLVCLSPDDLSLFLKGCKNHQLTAVTTCELNYPNLEFLCTLPVGSQFSLSLEKADNYYCMSHKDYAQITCK